MGLDWSRPSESALFTNALRTFQCFKKNISGFFHFTSVVSSLLRNIPITRVEVCSFNVAKCEKVHSAHQLLIPSHLHLTVHVSHFKHVCFLFPVALIFDGSVNPAHPKHIGSIDPSCDVVEVVKGNKWSYLLFVHTNSLFSPPLVWPYYTLLCENTHFKQKAVPSWCIWWELVTVTSMGHKKKRIWCSPFSSGCHVFGCLKFW